jgi:hypothetical protein
MVAGVGLLTVHVQSSNEVDAYKRQLLARGEKLAISEVLPSAVPAAQNGVDSLRSAFGAYLIETDEWTNRPPAMRMIASGKAIVGSFQTDVREYDFTNTWENVLIAATLDAPVREFLVQAASYPVLDFQLDYSKGEDLLLPHLAPFKKTAIKLSTAAICALHENDPASAVTNLSVLLALVQAAHDERILISQLVRIAMASIAVNASWELLQSTNVTDAELAALDQSWQRMEFTKSMENAFVMERAMNLATIQKMRTSNAEFSHVTGLFKASGSSGSGHPSGSGDWLQDLEDSTRQAVQNFKTVGATAMWRTSWTFSDELRLLKNDGYILAALRFAETNQCFQPAYSNAVSRLSPDSSYAGAIFDDVFTLDNELNLRQMFSGYAGAMISSVRKTMAAEAAKNIVITAIALKRFQLHHGNFPARLAGLTPEFLPAVPLDPVDGKPLRYRRREDGTFLLYSIGDDGVDNGGDPTMPSSFGGSLYWQGSHVRDWVWPQPATAAEIEAFYAHPPK